jgi:hypothetical protein
MKLSDLIKQAEGASRDTKTNEYPLESRQLSARVSAKTYAALDLMARSAQNTEGNENKTSGILIAEIIEQLLEENGMFEAMEISKSIQGTYKKEKTVKKEDPKDPSKTIDTKEPYDKKYSYVEARWKDIDSELYGTSQKMEDDEDEGK